MNIFNTKTFTDSNYSSLSIPEFAQSVVIYGHSGNANNVYLAESSSPATGKTVELPANTALNFDFSRDSKINIYVKGTVGQKVCYVIQ